MTTDTSSHEAVRSNLSAAHIYRLVTNEHICPYGLKAKALLKRRGYTVEDHHLKSDADADTIKQKYDVETTPQIFIQGKRIGGYDALRSHFGMSEAKSSPYQPVIATFGTALLLAAAASWATLGTVLATRTLLWFVALSMTFLAVFKLRDLESFTNQFLGYDLLAQRLVPYAYVYPFVELFAGIAMIAGVLTNWAAAAALFIGAVGAVSVVKAVYVDKRDLKCACVGGNSEVPLGFVSLTENLMMVAMATWMFLR